MKYLLRALPVLAIAAIAAAVTLIGGSTSAKAAACDVTLSASTGYYGGPSGTVLTATRTAQCGGHGWSWYRDGAVVQSNDSSLLTDTYTTVAGDTGHVITAIYSPGSGQTPSDQSFVATTGTSLLSDDFNGSSGTKPSSSVWTASTNTSYCMKYNGTGSMNESGTGFLAMNAQYSDQDSDGDSTSAADTDTESCDDGAVGDWLGSGLTSANTVTGARYAEMRVYYPCVDSDTGWTTSYGWEVAGFQGGGGGDEIDVWGARSRTDWGGTGNADYVLSPALQTWNETGSFDGDHDGDSVATDTDSTITTSDSDDSGGTDADDISSESSGHGDSYNAIGPTQYNSSTDVQSSEVCGTWNIYGALIQAHSVTYYFNGKPNYTAYTSSTYGTPNLGLPSTHDLTTASVHQILELGVYQAPPTGTANMYVDWDYIHVTSY